MRDISCKKQRKGFRQVTDQENPEEDTGVQGEDNAYNNKYLSV